MNYIRPLSDITLADIDEVGGKAAHLGAMLRAGFAVPPGFVIDVSAFVSHFGETTDPLVKPNFPLLQTELMTEVTDALVNYLGHEKEVAVRSSSTAEDGHEASFAGQHSTYYFVPPNHIDEAIIDCWMSLWSNAALAYRREGWAQVHSGEPVRMAVIVQKMVAADRSGVAFSRDPVNQLSRDCVIEASWGLGAALVDGRVSPDHIRVDEQENLTRYTVSDKQFQVSPKSKSNSGTRLQEVPRAKREARVLRDEEAASIANTAAQLETLFDSPQDVEWAYENDQLYILQSRPITNRASIVDVPHRLVLFKPLAENFTEPLTPLSEDLYAKVLPRVGCFVEGHFYLDLDKLGRANPFNLSDQELVDIALLRNSPKNLNPTPFKMLASFAVASLSFLVDGANWIRTARLTQDSLARYETLIRSVRENPKYDIARTFRRLVWGRHFFEPIGHQMIYANCSAGRYFIYIGILKALVERWAPTYPINELSRTYHGRQDMQSMALIKQLDELSRTLESCLAEEQGTELKDAVLKVINAEHFDLPSQSSFTQALEVFLHDFGHRGPKEMELASPSWREAPASLLAMIKNHQPRQDPATSLHGTHLAARDELHQQLKPWQAKITIYLTSKITQFISLRENTRHYHIMAFDAVRQKVLATERQLISDGKIKVPGDIFYLKLAEIEALENDRFMPEEAHQLIRTRRRDWQAKSRQHPAETLNIDLTPAESSSDHALTGQCACPGQVRGKARVIHSLSDAHLLEPNEILVAPYTDPAWTPLFSRASAIVVGTGSFLSHAGTVARELQTPCLVDVKGCTELIQTGEELFVNASEGFAELEIC